MNLYKDVCTCVGMCQELANMTDSLLMASNCSYRLSKCTLCLAHNGGKGGAGDHCSQACSSCAWYHWAYP